MRIEKDVWENAQIHELKHHHFSDNEITHYHDGYRKIFGFLGCNEESFAAKSILEVGPALHPALSYVSARKKVCVEPMFESFEKANKMRFVESGIEVISMPFEEIDFDDQIFDEIWLFNVLQHVIDPDDILKKSKKIAKLIRFFEPINCGTDVCHPHEFDLSYFRNFFSEDSVKFYAGGTMSNFHTADCAYGSYNTGI